MKDWPSDALYFLDPQQSRSHDQFSNLVVEFAEQNGADAFSLIGHSQGQSCFFVVFLTCTGGIVTLHTLNYYFTGLDESYVGALN